MEETNTEAKISVVSDTSSDTFTVDSSDSLTSDTVIRSYVPRTCNHNTWIALSFPIYYYMAKHITKSPVLNYIFITVIVKAAFEAIYSFETLFSIDAKSKYSEYEGVIKFVAHVKDGFNGVKKAFDRCSSWLCTSVALPSVKANILRLMVFVFFPHIVLTVVEPFENLSLYVLFIQIFLGVIIFCYIMVYRMTPNIAKQT